MQLKTKPRHGKTIGVRRQLMAASCALLGAAAARSQSSGNTRVDTGPFWQFIDGMTVDSALAYYHEDGRIHAVEPIVNLSKTFADGKMLNLNGTYDSLSGASPNGALTSNKPQTFASPSGTKSNAYTIAPGQLPADPNYHDDRVAVGANLEVPLTRLTRVSVGGKISDEHDFTSATLSASIAHDFNQKNTTVSLGVDDEYDKLNPIGGAPVAGSAYALQEKVGGETKDGIGALLGVTQVMTYNWLSELNLSIDRFHGYLNDPYKFISVLDAAGNTTGYQYESRADHRTRRSVYWENRASWSRVSAVLSLRYMTDDWQVHSDTAQLHVRFPFANRGQYIEPTVRWYRQSAANFYTPWIEADKPVTGNATSDTRLAAFHAVTYGVKYAKALAPSADGTSSEFSVRVEYYRQTLDDLRAAPAALQSLDLYPGLKAILAQVGWRF